MTATTVILTPRRPGGPYDGSTYDGELVLDGRETTVEELLRTFKELSLPDTRPALRPGWVLAYHRLCFACYDVVVATHKVACRPTKTMEEFVAAAEAAVEAARG